MSGGIFCCDSRDVVRGLSSYSTGAWLLHGMRGLSSPNRDGTHFPCIAGQVLSRWTTREVPRNRKFLVGPKSGPKSCCFLSWAYSRHKGVHGDCTSEIPVELWIMLTPEPTLDQLKPNLCGITASFQKFLGYSDAQGII